jgi:hypothetical protein
MKKIISIIIISLFIGCSFGVQGLFFKRALSFDNPINDVMCMEKRS